MPTEKCGASEIDQQGYNQEYGIREQRAGEEGTDKSKRRFGRVYKSLPKFSLTVNKINLKKMFFFCFAFLFIKAADIDAGQLNFTIRNSISHWHSDTLNMD